MKDYSLMDTVAAFSILLLSVLTAAFTLLYFFRSPWWFNIIGKIYLFKSALISLVLLQGSVSIFWSMEYPGRVWVRTVIYALGSIAYVPMIIALWREQSRDRRKVAKVKMELAEEQKNQESDEPKLF